MVENLFVNFNVILLFKYKRFFTKLMNPETDFSIRPFFGGYDKNFTYLITCSQTKYNILVDAACSIESNYSIYFKSSHSITDYTHTF